VIKSLKSLVVCAAFGVTTGLAVAQLFDDDPLEIAAGDVEGAAFWCGVECPSGWRDLFTCQEGQKCCGWYWCETETMIGQCCNFGQTCNLTQKPYQYQCVNEP